MLYRGPGAGGRKGEEEKRISLRVVSCLQICFIVLVISEKFFPQPLPLIRFIDVS